MSDPSAALDGAGEVGELEDPREPPAPGAWEAGADRDPEPSGLSRVPADSPAPEAEGPGGAVASSWAMRFAACGGEALAVVAIVAGWRSGTGVGGNVDPATGWRGGTVVGAGLATAAGDSLGARLGGRLTAP